MILFVKRWCDTGCFALLNEFCNCLMAYKKKKEPENRLPTEK